MRFMNTGRAPVCLVLIFILTGVSSPSLAKSSKYARPSSSDSADADKAGSVPAVPSKGDGSSGQPASPATAASSGDKKVDLTDLENRYWTAKDTEFNVVQNRLYTKSKRFSVSPLVGTILTDQYNTGYNFGLALNYYVSEREGVEIDAWSTTASPSDTVNYFSRQFGAQPDYNIPTGYVGANFNWIPVYAKLSLLEKKIFYFDMSISPGIGVTMMKSNVFSTTTTAPTQVNQNDVTLALDLAQQVFLDEHWALRLDLKNHLYNETVYQAGTGANLRSKITYYGSFMFGVTYFFGAGSRQQLQ